MQIWKKGNFSPVEMVIPRRFCDMIQFDTVLSIINNSLLSLFSF